MSNTRTRSLHTPQTILNYSYKVRQYLKSLLPNAYPSNGFNEIVMQIYLVICLLISPHIIIKLHILAIVEYVITSKAYNNVKKVVNVAIFIESVLFHLITL